MKTDKEVTSKWEVELTNKLYDLSGGADDYGNCMVDIDKAIPVILSLRHQDLADIESEVEKLETVYNEDYDEPMLSKRETLDIINNSKGEE